MISLRILTYNIAHGRGLTPIQAFSRKNSTQRKLLQISNLLKKHSPDIVTLQEIDQNSFWSGGINQIEFLQTHADYPYAVFGINAHRPSRLGLIYGNAILSKHPIIETEHMSFGRLRNVGQKGFLYAAIKAHGKHIPIVNIHLHYASRLQRLNQLDFFLHYLSQKLHNTHTYWSIPPIVCGDFNTNTQKPDAVATLINHLNTISGTPYQLHPVNGNTYPSPLPTRRLDFILLPPAVRNPRSEIIRTFLSDHRPVLTEFQIPKTTPQKTNSEFRVQS